MEAIANTVQFKFPSDAPQPSWVEIANFTKRLHSDLMQMEAVYRLPGRCLCIKYTSAAAMEASLQRHKESVKFLYSNGMALDVHVSVAGRNISYVRVFDLAPEVPDSSLTQVFAEYGKVERIVREKFPVGLGLDHLHTGIRGVYIEIENEIPASLEIGGWKVRIFHEGLKNKCFLCGLEGHYKDACPQRTRKPKQGTASYADVVESGASALADPGEVVIIEEDINVEELIEETTELTAEQQKVEQEQKERELREQDEAEQKRLKREKGLATLTEIAKAVKTAFDTQDANDRRTKFAAAGSTSTEMLRPFKAARKS